MKIKQHIPNLITLGNLLCGTIATIYAVSGDFSYAALFVVLGIVLDFFDGFVARLLKVSGELGKQLDSLADMVTSGVVPGVIMFKLIELNFFGETEFYNDSFLDVALIGLLLTLAACYRLANFNLDTRQTDSFIGLPTPAMCLFVISLPLIYENSNIDFVNNLIGSNYFLIIVTCTLSYLMNAEIPLFSLKLKSFSVQKNWFVYLFLIISLLFIIFLNYISIPIIIILYVLLSILKNVVTKK
ncbi:MULTISPECIES: CDP-alcohol phosphatidyltransferase family protein [unclassified Polaribacter]|uniref:CDP-alcohol phosphatidyltransferase family protein n=1 Tax=unclassified Polaribacter TaxID=196858 RepID=UPI000068C618|nr:CDP-alcohol phosphatidyltransferase family protein [Polaribacter sp. MED152]EAQ41542.1 CDP-alcohol phosphatidyltransferase [Polaribacter sp. MED152]